MSLRVRDSLGTIVVGGTFDFDFRAFVISFDGAVFSIKTPKGRTSPRTFPVDELGQAMRFVDALTAQIQQAALQDPNVQAAIATAVAANPT